MARSCLYRCGGRRQGKEGRKEGRREGEGKESGRREGREMREREKCTITMGSLAMHERKLNF